MADEVLCGGLMEPYSIETIIVCLHTSSCIRRLLVVMGWTRGMTLGPG